MAKKKRQPGKKAAKKAPAKAKAKGKAGKRPPARRAPPGLLPPDLEDALMGLLGPGGEIDDEAPTLASRAMDLALDALDEPEPEARDRLARAALVLDPDCADAFLVLAEDARGRKEALELFEAALAAAERALGPDHIEAARGEFWLDHDTRPYMRAREGLAHTLWTLGRREQAADHLRAMLDLNPNDNQGVRYTLASWLLSLDRDDELDALLRRYEEDDSATWAYTRALLGFRRGGDTPGARRLLDEAVRVNRHVPAVLLGERPLPAELPGSYVPGSDEEAVLYAASGLAAWKSTPGAITWLRQARAPVPRKKSPAKKKAPAPPKASAALARRLRAIRQESEVWLADFRELPRWLETEDGRVRPWFIVIVSAADGHIVGSNVLESEPGAGPLWDALVGAIQKPLMGEPARPEELHVRPDPRWDALREPLAALGVTLGENESPELFDALYADLSQHLNRDLPPTLVEMPGTTPEQVAGFYAAAATYYRRAPWKALGYEEAIRIACDEFDSGPWYAVVMGQSGLTLGLALYEDLELLRRMWAGEFTDEGGARETVALTVTFDQEEDVPPGELDAIRAHGWEVAGPEAYPSVFRKERGLTMRPPLAWELQLLEACLRALPEFIARHKPGDTAPRRMAVPTASGELSLGLSWVEDD
jgi:tetratricopeptide (TPR) repeat protein